MTAELLELYEAQFRGDPGPPDPEGPGDGVDDDGGLDTAVAHRKQRLRVDREARRQLDAEDHPRPTIPEVRPLSTLLAEPDAPTAYRVDRLMPTGARIMLAAQFKAGKSTLVANLIRAMVDGTAFLGVFDVRQPARRLVLIDDELGDTLLRRWLADQDIANPGAVADVVSLRGRVGAFDLLDPDIRRQWADRLRALGCDFLVLDCLRPVLDALGLDENHEAGKFLVAFDALLYEAGIDGALLVQHMGHSGERSRGDSRLQDWPDAIWRLVRQDDDPGSDRYFSAYGRDVDVHEGRLTFDPRTRWLSYGAGSRIDAKAEAAFGDVLDVLVDDHKAGGSGLSGRAIEQGVDHPRQVVRDAIRLAVQREMVVVEDGARRAKLHRIACPCAECGRPVTGGRERHESCTPPEVEGPPQ